MTIDQAIEELEDQSLPPELRFTTKFVYALQLSIEALKAWKQFRDGKWVSGRYDLPGETEK